MDDTYHEICECEKEYKPDSEIIVEAKILPSGNIVLFYQYQTDWHEGTICFLDNKLTILQAYGRSVNCMGSTIIREDGGRIYPAKPESFLQILSNGNILAFGTLFDQGGRAILEVGNNCVANTDFWFFANDNSGYMYISDKKLRNEFKTNTNRHFKHDLIDTMEYNRENNVIIASLVDKMKESDRIIYLAGGGVIGPKELENICYDQESNSRNELNKPILDKTSFVKNISDEFELKFDENILLLINKISKQEPVRLTCVVSKPLGAFMLSDRHIVVWSPDENSNAISIRILTIDGLLVKTISVNQDIPRWAREFSDPWNFIYELTNNSFIYCQNDKCFTMFIVKSTGDIVSELIGHKGKVSNIHIFSDGTFFSWSWEDGTVRIWRQDGSAVSTINKWCDHLYTVKLEANDEIYAMAKNGAERWWNKHGLLLRKTSADIDKINVDLGWSRQNRLLDILPGSRGSVLSNHNNQKLRLWQCDGTHVSVLEECSNEIKRVLFTQDKNKLLVLYKNSYLHLWDFSSHQHTLLADLIAWIAVVGNGNIVAHSHDGNIVIWKSDGKLFNRIEGDFCLVQIFNKDSLRCFSYDGSIMSITQDGTISHKQCGHHRKIVKYFEIIDGRYLVIYEDSLRLYSQENELLSSLVYDFVNSIGADDCQFKYLIDDRILISTGRQVFLLDSNEIKCIYEEDGGERYSPNVYLCNNGYFSIVDAEIDGTDKNECLYDSNGKFLLNFEREFHNLKVLSSGNIIMQHDKNTLRLWVDGCSYLKSIVDENRISPWQRKWSNLSINKNIKEVLMPGIENAKNCVLLSNEQIRLYNYDGSIWLYKFDGTTLIDISMSVENSSISKTQSDIIQSRTVLYEEDKSVFLTTIGEKTALQWQSDAKLDANYLFENGQIILSNSDAGDVSFLHVYIGNEPIDIKKFEQSTANLGY